MSNLDMYVGQSFRCVLVILVIYFNGSSTIDSKAVPLLISENNSKKRYGKIKFQLDSGGNEEHVPKLRYICYLPGNLYKTDGRIRKEKQ